MTPQQYLYKLALAHYRYRRAYLGSDWERTQRILIYTYQRLYHAATGTWPTMALINETIRRYAVEFCSPSLPSVPNNIYATNSGPGGPDCEAKSIRTCRCSPAAWKPITMPNRISPEEARRRLRKGIRVENPLGEKVTLDSRLEQHWQRGNKSQADINARLAALPLIEEVVKNPAEIWENPNGSRTYLSSVVNPYQPNGKSYTVAFTQSADNTVLETYHINDRISFNKRQGKQLWPKK